VTFVLFRDFVWPHIFKFALQSSLTTVAHFSFFILLLLLTLFLVRPFVIYCTSGDEQVKLFRTLSLTSALLLVSPELAISFVSRCLATKQVLKCLHPNSSSSFFASSSS
jgi:hypothetical protein